MASYSLFNVVIATLPLLGVTLVCAELKPQLSLENDDKKLQ